MRAIPCTCPEIRLRRLTVARLFLSSIWVPTLTLYRIGVYRIGWSYSQACMKIQTKTILVFILMLLVGGGSACACYLKTGCDPAFAVQRSHTPHKSIVECNVEAASDHSPCGQACPHCERNFYFVFAKPFDLNADAANLDGLLFVLSSRYAQPLEPNNVPFLGTKFSWHDPPTPTPVTLGILLLV